MFKCQTEPTNR